MNKKDELKTKETGKKTTRAKKAKSTKSTKKDSTRTPAKKKTTRKQTKKPVEEINVAVETEVISPVTEEIPADVSSVSVETDNPPTDFVMTEESEEPSFNQEDVSVTIPDFVNKTVAIKDLPTEEEVIAESEPASEETVPAVETVVDEIPENGDKKEELMADEKPIKAKWYTWVACIFVWSLIVIGGIGGIFGLYAAFKMTKDKPELTRENLESKESSVIYDAYNNPVIELGLYLRQNVSYEELPNNLIDAFLAIEDSRFFTHFGFDIPRFSKAIIANLRSRDFSQGGSTITMQLIKNSYFQVDAGSDSTMASREGVSGVKRKAQEILLAIEANHKFSKKEILSFFLNKINFGNNIRGVEKAAQYYYGKSVRELSLPESAFLAGIINSPNNYNPYNDIHKHTGNIYLNENIEYLENATGRRNEVLDLMLQHGYITKEECALAKSVQMEDLLSGTSEKFSETSRYYQSYIDAVIEEAQEVTGKDPYTTAMEIHTNMDPHMQKYVYDLQNGNIEGYHLDFLDEDSQNALVVLNNQTGELIALGGGRGQTESRMFNRATSAYIQPGSTVKTILEYALAFDWLGWSTTHTITDKPIYLYNGHVLIANAGGQPYTGDMLLTEAVARSLNTPAIQALEAVVEATSEQAVIDYLNKIGFHFKYEDFDLQFAIGGNKMIVTPVQLAAAHAILMNKGYYVKPHTIHNITFSDGSEYVADTKGEQALSEEAAYLTAFLEENNVSQTEFGNLMNVLRSDYPVYAKTGTTDWGDAGVSYGIPVGAARDLWLVAQTSKYTVAVWNGYDKLERGSYFSYYEDLYNQKGYLGKALLDELNKYFDYHPQAIQRPEGVEEITHIKGVYPYAYPTAGTPITGLVKKEFNKLVDVSTIDFKARKSGLSGMGGGFNDAGNLVIEWQGFGASNGDGTCDISATNAFGETTKATGRCFYNPGGSSHYPSAFYADIYRNGELINSVTSGSPTYTSGSHAWKGETLRVCGYTSEDSNQQCTDITR